MRRRPSSSTWVSLALACLGGPAALTAQDAGAPSGAAFLLLPVGARATAMGQAGVAEGGSSEAAFWNPAGLGSLASSEFGVQYSSTFASRNTAIGVYLLSSRLGTAGVTAYLVDYGSQSIVPPGGGLPGGRIAPKNIELIASYATGIGSLVSIGVSYKLVQFRQDCQGECGNLGSVTGTTQAVDIGAQVVVGPGGALRLGAVLQHAGFKLQLENREQADPLPTRLGIGAAYRIPFRLADGQNVLDARVLMDLQDDWGEYNSPDARLGVELGYDDAVYVRGGYAFLRSETRGPSLGIGVRFERVFVDVTRVFYQTGAFEDPLFLGLRISL